MNPKAEFPVTHILSSLEQDDLLPAIIFRTSRRQCDADLRALSKSRAGRISPEAYKTLQREVSDIVRHYDMPEDLIYDHPQYQVLMATGSGAHHAGQLLMWRLLLEELMTRGALRLMIATGTVAAGVDFPARTVVITAHSKRGADGFGVLTSTELQQMSGRAGRRGKDSVGFCVVAPGPYADARVIEEVSKRPPEPLRSVYFASPSTVLNLLKYRNVDDLRFTVSRSLAAFLDRKAAAGLDEEAGKRETETDAEELSDENRKRALKRVRRMRSEAEILRVRQNTQLESTLDVLRKLGFVEGAGLSPKGFWAAELCTSLVLELAEAIDEGLLEDLSLHELVGLIASIAGDPHRTYFSLKQNPIKKDLFAKMGKVLERVQQVYKHPGNADVQVVPDAALTVITWMESDNWPEFSSLLRLAGVADGDISRLVSQTADHLNQISRLQQSHPELARLAREGRERILKPPLAEGIVA